MNLCRAGLRQRPGPTVLSHSTRPAHASTAFEGMKAYMGPDGEVRLFRPERNLARLARSAARVAPRPFNPDELLKLIRALVLVEKRWFSTERGHSLYIRLMIAGTRETMGFVAPNSALLWVMCAPTWPFFRGGVLPLSLLAIGDTVREWPGGTGEHKIATLWLFGDKIIEAGATNLFMVIKHDDSGIDPYTPPLDGTILRGITRESILALAGTHPERTILLRIHSAECVLTMPELEGWLAQGRVLEIFTVGTAVIVAPVGRIGYEGRQLDLPRYDGGLGPIVRALHTRITDIQNERFEWEDWSVRCE